MSEETCANCGGRFTDPEWDDRHTDPDGRDVHADCCPTCDTGGAA